MVEAKTHPGTDIGSDHNSVLGTLKSETDIKEENSSNVKEIEVGKKTKVKIKQ